MFERFWQGDKSRSQAGTFGLGLGDGKSHRRVPWRADHGLGSANTRLSAAVEVAIDRAQWSSRLPHDPAHKLGP
ncbi:MAG: hypothetical protein NTZ53_03310 [Cyanobacteria bacterium]|nr:hypothetical protein [Cyanobacteriota bacterium]